MIFVITVDYAEYVGQCLNHLFLICVETYAYICNAKDCCNYSIPSPSPHITGIEISDFKADIKPDVVNSDLLLTICVIF